MERNQAPQGYGIDKTRLSAKICFFCFTVTIAPRGIKNTSAVSQVSRETIKESYGMHKQDRLNIRAT